MRPATLLVLSALLSAIPAQAARRFGLFVGANDAPADRPPLRHAETDAERVRGVFVEVGAMAADDAVLLLAPTPDEILEAVAALGERVAGERDAIAVFYYSGHADDRALLPGPDPLPITDLRAALDSVPATVAVQVLDACRAGAWTRSKGARLGAEVSVQVRPRAEGRVVIASTAAWEDAQESDRLGGSFFTVHFVSGLRGAADVDDDGAVTLAEAYAYVYDRTVESTMATLAGPQHPTYRYDLEGRGDTVLTWPGAHERSAMLRLSGGREYVVIDAVTERIVAEVRTRPEGVRLALRPGAYRVRRRDAEAVLEGDLDLGPGAVAMADDHLDREVPLAELATRGPGADARHAIRFGGGWRGSMGDRAGPALAVRLAYGWAGRYVTLQPRIGVARNLADGAVQTPRLELDVLEVSAGVEARWPLRVGPLVISPGVAVDALWLRQSETSGAEPDRDAFGLLAGGLVGVRSPRWRGWAIFADGEVDAVTFPATDADRAPTGEGEAGTEWTFRTLTGAEYAF